MPIPKPVGVLTNRGPATGESSVVLPLGRISKLPTGARCVGQSRENDIRRARSLAVFAPSAIRVDVFRHHARVGRVWALVIEKKERSQLGVKAGYVRLELHAPAGVEMGINTDVLNALYVPCELHEQAKHERVGQIVPRRRVF